MFVLLGMSVTAVAIVLVKLVQFSRLGLRRSVVADQAYELVAKDDADGALRLLASSKGPVARVMERAIALGTDSSITRADTDAEISRVGSREVRSMESGLRGLSAIAHLSPLLGLLGTVMGMIAAFRQLQNAGSKADPALLSGGIWEALLTTAFGLAVAIPAMALFFWLEGQVDNEKSAMKDAAVRVLVHFRKLGAGSDFDAPDRAVSGEDYGV